MGLQACSKHCSQPRGEIRHPSNPAQFQKFCRGMRGTMPARCHLFCRRLGTLHLQGRDKQKFSAGPSLNNACTQYKRFRGISKKLKGQLHVQWTAHCTVARRRGRLAAATLHRVPYNRRMEAACSKASKDDFCSGQSAIMLTGAGLILVVVE